MYVFTDGTRMEITMRRDERGMSLVELIIVVAIMSVLLGVTGFGISMVSGKPAEECARKITYSLQSARTEAMGKYIAEYQLSRDAVTGEAILTATVYDSVSAVTPRVTRSVVGAKDVSVEYDLDDGTHQSIDSAPITFTFERGTGAFRPVAGTSCCVTITVSKASTIRNISLVPPTGHVAIN